MRLDLGFLHSLVGPRAKPYAGNQMSYLSHPWNQAVALLQMFFGTQILSTGSCFFWRHEGSTFLVTNWHNLTGRNPLTGASASNNGGRPDYVEFMAYKRVSENNENGTFEMMYESVRVQLCDPDLTNHRWYEHPQFGRQVDIGAIDVTELVSEYLISHVNELEADAIHDPLVAQDVYVVGFPFGAISGAPAPVWKRGTIALDPSFDPEGLPKILIDTATREGMSGSVVVARHLFWGSGYKRKDGSTADPILLGQHDTVLGIYSGRHYPDLELAQLGIVWRRRCLEELLAGRKYAVLPPG